MSYMIKIKCCICKKHFGNKKGGNEPNMVSHGYCEDCLIKVEAEIKEFFKNKKKLNNN